MEQLNCFLCPQLILSGLDGLAHHFRRHHGLTLSRGIEGTGFICAQNGCDANFMHFYNLRNHIRNVHLRAPGQILVDQIDENFDHQNEENIQIRGIEDHPDVVENNPDVVMEDNAHIEDECIDDNESYLEAHVIKMIAKFHCNDSMTGSMITEILNESEELISIILRSLKRKLLLQIRQGQIVDENCINNLVSIFEMDSPFKGFKSYKQQMEAITQESGYIEPVEIPLGNRIDTKLHKESCTYIPALVIESFQYVPIIDVLKLVVSSKNVRQAISQEQPSPPGMFSSFIDAQHFKTHPFFQKYKNALRIRLYYDELEIVNPLGSKTCIHKLGVFYYQISNVPAHMNSELCNIHVLLVCSYEDVRKYGFERILNVFIEDLKKLETDEGITLEFEDECFILRATIESFCGDGLAVHEVFNLLGPSSNQFCRLCLYSREDLHAGSLEKGQERTEQIFNEHVHLLQQTNFSAATKTATGVKGNCCLNELKFFHISRNKVFDIMHDLLCGICPMIIKLVLHQYVIVQKIFDISYLNGTISQFNYGYVEYKNKPSANFTEILLNRREHTLSQKAMQVWYLMRALPFLLSAKVATGDEHMKLILNMLRIMEIVFAPKINQTLLPYLDELIKEFINHFITLFPEVHLINKFHHLTHYPECIQWSGPLLPFYCMRFEAKHYELKLRAQNVHNFKNPPKTLVRISQCVQFSQWGSKNVRLNRLEVLSGKTKIVNNLLSKDSLINLGYKLHDEMLCAKCIAINGVEFRKNLFVALEKAVEREDDLILFGRIEEMIVLEGDRVYFLTSICTTRYFDVDVNAYAIRLEERDCQLQFIEASDLAFYKPFCYWTKLNSTDFVTCTTASE